MKDVEQRAIQVANMIAAAHPGEKFIICSEPRGGKSCTIDKAIQILIESKGMKEGMIGLVDFESHSANLANRTAHIFNQCNDKWIRNCWFEMVQTVQAAPGQGMLSTQVIDLVSHMVSNGAEYVFLDAVMNIFAPVGYQDGLVDYDLFYKTLSDIAKAKGTVIVMTAHTPSTSFSRLKGRETVQL